MPLLLRFVKGTITNFADITIFDPATINGVADYAPGTSSLPSKGFVHVLVNGETVLYQAEIRIRRHSYTIR